nr:udp-arabinopyranose mutase 1 [Quercus suber]
MEIAKDPSGRDINALQQHIENLLTPPFHFSSTLFTIHTERVLTSSVDTLLISSRVSLLLFLMASGSTSLTMMLLPNLLSQGREIPALTQNLKNGYSNFLKRANNACFNLTEPSDLTIASLASVCCKTQFC